MKPTGRLRAATYAVAVAMAGSFLLTSAPASASTGGTKITDRGSVAREAKPRPSNHPLKPLAGYVARPLRYCGLYDNIQYPCGPTMFTSTSYAIFWQPTGFSYLGNYKPLMSQFLGDVGGNNLYKIATQYWWTWNNYKYFIQNNSTYGGSYLDTTPFPQHCNHPYTGSNCITRSDIQQAIVRAMSAKGWTGGYYHQFFLFTPYGEGSCDTADCTTGLGASYKGYCAYHGSFSVTYSTGAQDSVLFSDMPYSQDPYDYYTAKTNNCDKLPGSTGPGTGKSPNSNVAADSEISTLSHEMMETVTDPYGSWLGTGTYLGWTDNAATISDGGGEIGDKCSVNVIGAIGWGAESFDNGLADMWTYNNATSTYHYYNVQKEFSNTAFFAGGSTAPGAGCVMSG